MDTHQILKDLKTLGFSEGKWRYAHRHAGQGWEDLLPPTQEMIDQRNGKPDKTDARKKGTVSGRVV